MNNNFFNGLCAETQRFQIDGMTRDNANPTTSFPSSDTGTRLPGTSYGITTYRYLNVEISREVLFLNTKAHHRRSSPIYRTGRSGMNF
eukprot:scaffold10372_cov44-Attheya_sp.AAC.4